jgi:prepilin-type N-terminal cleavage/methylation domain-containing protein
MTTRRGFTLVELLIGLILLLAVGAVTYQLLVNTQRVTRSQTQHIGMQDNGRSGTMIVANELREAGYDELTAASAGLVQTWLGLAAAPAAVNNPDLVAIGSDSITYRAMRAFGFTCNKNSGTPEITVRNSGDSQWRQLRTLTVNDSLLLYVENDPSIAGDDIWVAVGIAGILADQNCPDGTTGKRYRLAWPAGLNAAGLTAAKILDTGMIMGGPVRGFEMMQIRSYTSNGKLWLGMRSRPQDNATAIEPVLGPLANGAGAAQGLTFTYLDKINNATAVRNDVRSVQISLLPISDEVVRTTGRYAGVDTLKTPMSTRVALRNALRP